TARSQCELNAADCVWNFINNRCETRGQAGGNFTGCIDIGTQQDCSRYPNDCFWDITRNQCFPTLIIQCHSIMSQQQCVLNGQQCEWKPGFNQCINKFVMPCDRFSRYSDCNAFPECSWDFFRFSCYNG